MAVTLQGRSLTEAHRLAQLALSKSSVRDFLAVWRLLDPAQLSKTFPGYYRAAKLIIDANRSKSTNLAAAYLGAFRTAEGVTVPLTAARAAELADEAAMKSLLVTGPVEIKKGMTAGKSLEAATRQALGLSAGAVTRHVLNAGRETINGSASRDPAARGVARVTDGSPCYFCAMLASRGAVYTRETADFHCHDRCGCSVEVIYGDAYELPGRAQEFSDLYASATSGVSGEKAAQIAFRRAYEGR